MKTLLAILALCVLSFPALACEGFEYDMQALEKIVHAPKPPQTAPAPQIAAPTH
jgi:hypothetical protein